MIYPKPLNDQEYHIFTNNQDEWSESIEDILKILEDWLNEGIQDIRIYEANIWDKKEGVWEGEYCIFSIGEWPM